MESFSGQLRKIRQKSFPQSAKSAWQHWHLKGLKINYAYYMRLEQGKARPTPEIINQIASLLSQLDGELLIKSYCADLFPNSSYLFALDGGGGPHRLDRQDSVKTMSQHFLSPRQIHVLSSTVKNYHLFLLTTLARRPLKLTELSRYFKKSELEQSLKDLLQEKILMKVDGGYEATNPDVRFPEAESDQLKEIYRRLDQWDQDFGDSVQMDTVVQKMILRRTSFRYSHLIEKQLEMIFESIRCADELNTRYNENVLQLQVVLKKGRLPG